MRYHENQRHKKAHLSELKDSKAKLDLKCYFFKQLNAIEGWNLFSIIVDKHDWSHLHKGKIHQEQFYDQAVIQLLQTIPLQEHNMLIIDRSKSQENIDALNANIEKAFASTSTKLLISHDHSFVYASLQTVDIFSWGIARKYEQNDTQWYEIFKERIARKLEV